MKTVEIVPGKRYTDGKGNERVLVEARKFHDALNDPDQVRFTVVRRGRRGHYRVGDESFCTRNSFARWAKAVVE